MIFFAILAAFIVATWCGFTFGGSRGAIVLGLLLVMSGLVALGVYGTGALELLKNAAGVAFFLGLAGLAVGVVLRFED